MAKSKAKVGDFPRGLHTLTDLEQVRVLADPLRLKILAAFAEAPRTTKQVAEGLGEKPTRLYHHVEALERVGLITLTKTAPKRGTVEKYYRAVASQFQVPAALFAPEGQHTPESGLTALLDTVRRELLACVHSRPAPGEAAREPPVVARVLVTGSAKKIQAVRRQFLRWIQKLESAGQKPGARAGPPTAGRQFSYALTAVFCPMEDANDA